MPQDFEPLKFQQRLDENCVLVIFKDRTSKLTEIALGNDVVAARKTAQAIIDTIRASDGHFTE